MTYPVETPGWRESCEARGIAVPTPAEMERGTAAIYSPPAAFGKLAPDHVAFILSGFGGVGYGLPVDEQRAWANR